MGAVAVDPGRAGPAGPDRAAGRRRDRDERDRAADRGVQADGDLVEEAVRRRGHRLAWRTGPGQASRGSPMDCCAIALAATAEPPPRRLGVTHWSSRLLAAELGISNVKVRGRVAGVGAAAVAHGELQVLHRPAAGGQGPRRHRLVPEPAGQGRGALRGRETPDPGAGTHIAGAAHAPGIPESAATTTSGMAPPRCSPRWRPPPARSPAPATPGTRHEEYPAIPQAGRQDLPAGAAAHRLRQLRHPYPPGRTGLAGQAPPDHAALHADVRGRG